MITVSLSLIAGVMIGLEFQRDADGEVLVIDLLILRVMFEWE
jgi:hypothetical protein